MTRIERPTQTGASRLRRLACLALLACAVALPSPSLAEQATPQRRAGGDVATVPAANRAAAGAQAKKAPAGQAQGQDRAQQQKKKQASARPEATRQAAVHAPQKRIQCVQYVLANSAFRVRGNARDWWRNSAAIHARDSVPEPGSVLSFRSVKSMPLGHVALVTKVVSSREILIDHANWTRGAISRDHSVIDVSPRNDWTTVRLGVKPGVGATTYGSVYPTDGFIHARARDEVLTLAEKPAGTMPSALAVPDGSTWLPPTTRTSRDPG